MLPGAARSAIDLALWDLECKIKNKPISDLLNLTPLKPLTTAFTLSLDSASNMAKAAREAEAYSLIKIKLGGHDGIEGDMERLQAIRAVLPTHKLIADINEGWSMEALDQYAHHLKTFKLDMIEQPVGAKRERNLDQFDLPFCARSFSSRTKQKNHDRLHGGQFVGDGASVYSRAIGRPR